MTDLFTFWEECAPVDRIHPRDVAVFDRAGNMGFDLDCLPACFAGPLRTAPVVLLYLSPGWNPDDVVEASTQSAQERYADRRKGFRPLDGEDEHPHHFRWWSRRTAAFGEPQVVRNKVAILNIGAYHSERFTDSHALMALPSSRAVLDWAQSNLFPAAERGERVVVCLRKARAWGLTRSKSYPGTLFVPPTNAAGHMINGAERETVVAAIQRAIAT